MMQALPAPESPRLLLSFDFDGTLHEPEAGYPLDPRFFDVIQQLREKYGALWAVNTGRSLFQTVQGINEAKFPFLPDCLIAREREIYKPSPLGRWVDMGRWNTDCAKAHAKLFRKSRRVLKKLRKYVETETSARWIEQEDEPAGVIATTEEEMERISNMADELCAKTPMLSHERNTIYMRFSHAEYNKGSALKALAESMDLQPESTFAIGDGHNDLTKLNRDIAHHIACPANAHPEVQRCLLDQGGYLAKACYSHGVLEALEHFFPL